MYFFPFAESPRGTTSLLLPIVHIYINAIHSTGNNSGNQDRKKANNNSKKQKKKREEKIVNNKKISSAYKLGYEKNKRNKSAIVYGRFNNSFETRRILFLLTSPTRKKKSNTPNDAPPSEKNKRINTE